MIDKTSRIGKVWQTTTRTASQVLGIKDVAAGIDSFEQGSHIEGAGKTTSGSADLTSGVAGAASVLGVQEVAGLALTSVASGAGGVSLIAQGLTEMYRSTQGRVTSAAKVGAGSLALTGLAIELPALAVTGTLAGVALVAYQNRHQALGAAQTAWGGVRRLLSRD